MQNHYGTHAWLVTETKCNRSIVTAQRFKIHLLNSHNTYISTSYIKLDGDFFIEYMAWLFTFYVIAKSPLYILEINQLMNSISYNQSSCLKCHDIKGAIVDNKQSRNL